MELHTTSKMAQHATSRPSAFKRFRSRVGPKSESIKEGSIFAKQAPQDSQPSVSLPDIKPEDIVIAVMGVTGVGKSTFISHLSRTAVAGDGVRSCTATISVHTAFLEGRDIYLIDTPGFDDTTRTDTEILLEIAAWLKKSYDDKVQLAGIVYLHRISDNRVGGSGTKNILLFKELCGEKAMSCIVLATSMWDLMPLDKAEQREDELVSKEEFWGGLIRHGCRVIRQDDGSVSATRIIRHILAQKSPGSFQIQDEMANGTPLIRTRAGKVLEEKIDEQARKFDETIKRLEDEIARLKAEKVETDKREGEERERRRQQAQEEEEKREREEREERERRDKAIEDRLKTLEEKSSSAKSGKERNENEKEQLKGTSRWPCIVM